MQMLTTIDTLPEQAAKRLQERWGAVFYRDYFCRLDEHPYAVLYSEKDSCPNTPVNVLVGLESLKSGFNWSDEEVHTDGGYNSDRSYRELRDRGITLVQTAIRGHAPHWHLGLDQFTLAAEPAVPPSDAVEAAPEAGPAGAAGELPNASPDPTSEATTERGPAAEATRTPARDRARPRRRMP
ncbi:MAG: hypothetical protein HY331_01660 [Chloroflexi bacterium]|nr:hypothetical protein [Chloroflexota bacterium]